MSGSMSPSLPPDDRREALRQPTQELPFQIEHAGDGPQDGVLLDVSRTGVRFRSRYCVPCGTTITLHPPVGTGLHANLACVVRQSLVDSEDGQMFEYGARFTEGTEMHRHTWFLTLRRAA